MIELFKHYFYGFLHPVETQKRLRLIRESEFGRSPLKLVGEHTHLDDNGPYTLSLTELLGTSWIFVFVKAIYGVIGIYIGISLYSDFTENASEYLEFIDQLSFNTRKWALISILVDAVFFPLYGLTYVKLWEVLIRTFARLFGKQASDDDAYEQVVAYSLVSNLFLLVPILGGIVRFFASFVYLFVGLKRNLGFSRIQAMVTLVSPLVLICTFFVALLAYWAMIISVMMS